MLDLKIFDNVHTRRGVPAKEADQGRQQRE